MHSAHKYICQALQRKALTTITLTHITSHHIHSVGKHELAAAVATTTENSRYNKQYSIVQKRER